MNCYQKRLCYADDIAYRADSKENLKKHIQQLEKVYGKLTVKDGPKVHFFSAKFHLPRDTRKVQAKHNRFHAGPLGLSGSLLFVLRLF